VSLVRWQGFLLLQVLYSSGGVLLVSGAIIRDPAIAWPGIGLLIAAGITTVVEQLNRYHREQLEKIDQSVGKVYEAGGRATERRLALAASSRADAGAANVRRFVPRP
jgi:hypothetical protein